MWRLLNTKTVRGAITVAAGYLLKQDGISVADVISAVGGVVTVLGARDAVDKAAGLSDPVNEIVPTPNFQPAETPSGIPLIPATAMYRTSIVEFFNDVLMASLYPLPPSSGYHNIGTVVSAWANYIGMPASDSFAVFHRLLKTSADFNEQQLAAATALRQLRTGPHDPAFWPLVQSMLPK